MACGGQSQLAHRSLHGDSDRHSGDQREPQAEQAGVQGHELDRLEHAGQRHQAGNVPPKSHADDGDRLGPPPKSPRPARTAAFANVRPPRASRASPPGSPPTTRRTDRAGCRRLRRRWSPAADRPSRRSTPGRDAATEAARRSGSIFSASARSDAAKRSIAAENVRGPIRRAAIERRRPSPRQTPRAPRSIPAADMLAADRRSRTSTPESSARARRRPPACGSPRARRIKRGNQTQRLAVVVQGQLHFRGLMTQIGGQGGQRPRRRGVAAATPVDRPTGGTPPRPVRSSPARSRLRASRRAAFCHAFDGLHHSPVGSRARC